MLCKVMSYPKASLLSVVRVQPGAVLLHLPPDDQEHLRHILRELFAEKCAEKTNKCDRERRALCKSGRGLRADF